MESKWSVRDTCRGLRLVDNIGYTYCKDRHVGDRSYWRCDYRKFKCKARASILGKWCGPKKGELLCNGIVHNHSPQMNDSDYEDSKPANMPSNAPSPAPSSSSMTSNIKPPIPQPVIIKPIKSVPVKALKSTSSASSIAEESEVCLRWNSHHSNMQTTFPNLMDKEQYVDVTLAADGNIIKCHKLILSSCSAYFDDILKSVPSFHHPIIFLQNMEFWIVKSLVEFMYKGEVNVDESKLQNLLQAAENLQIKGLAKQTTVKTENEDKDCSVPETYINEEMEEYLRPDSPPCVANPGDEEEFKPYYYYKKKLKKNRKRKVPAPGQLKTVPCNLKGTKTRPNIKQPVFYDPDFPDHDPSRGVSPPAVDKDPVFHIDNIKIEPIDVETPTYYDSADNEPLRSYSDETAQEKLPLIVQLQSGKPDFDEPPTKKPSISIKAIKSKDNMVRIEKISPDESPVTIEKLATSDDVQVTVEKIPEVEDDKTELQKKFCIRVVKMNQLNGKNDTKEHNATPKTETNTQPLITVKKFQSEPSNLILTSPNLTSRVQSPIPVFDTKNPPPLVKICLSKDPTLPSTSKNAELGFKKIKLTTTESVLQKLAKSQLTAALELQDRSEEMDDLCDNDETRDDIDIDAE